MNEVLAEGGVNCNGDEAVEVMFMAPCSVRMGACTIVVPLAAERLAAGSVSMDAVGMLCIEMLFECGVWNKTEALCPFMCCCKAWFG